MGDDERKRAGNEVLLDALAAGLSHTEAAALAGVSAKTIQRRLGDTEFALELTRRRAARVEELVGQLTSMGATAIGVLREAMVQAKPELRLRAAEATLTWLTRLRREVDFELRLCRIEAGTAVLATPSEEES